MTKSNDTSAIAGASSGLYVDCRMLRPGDVLLSRGHGKPASAIAAWTNGPYSHAAIVVSDSWLFESDDVGVGYTPLELTRVEVIESENHLLGLLRGTQAAEVRRYPGLENRQPEQLSAALREILQPFAGLEYPEWSALADAGNRGAIGNAAMGAILRLRDSLEKGTLWNPGPFCSQLAALALGSLGLLQDCDAFRDASRVNPNTFLAPPSFRVEGAVRCANPEAQTNNQLLATLPDRPTREEWTGELVQDRIQVAKIQSLVADFSAVLDGFHHLIRHEVTRADQDSGPPNKRLNPAAPVDSSTVTRPRRG